MSASVDPPPAPAAPPVGAALPPGLRVLVVDDAPEVAHTVRAMLTRLQCSVAVCLTGEDALALLGRTQPFDLMLADIHLGAGIDGVELARLVQPNHPSLAVLLMSGSASEPAQLTDGATALPLLPKPFTRDQLVRSMLQALAAAGDVQR